MFKYIYFLSFLQLLYQCPINCNTCTDLICITCNSHYFLNLFSCDLCPSNCQMCSNSIYCTTCSISYYLNQGICLQCKSNCLSCQSQTNCTDCMPLYYVNNTIGQCQKCADGCIQCENNSYCQLCQSQYINDDGQCIINHPVKSEINKLNFIMIGISPLFICIFLVIICFIIAKKYPNLIRDLLIKQQQQQQQKHTGSIKQFSSVSQDCCICLQSNTNTLTQCNHYFHIQCLKLWSEQKRCCPMCKNKNIGMVTIRFCLSCKYLLRLFNLYEKNFNNKIQRFQQQQQFLKHKCERNGMELTQIELNNGQKQKQFISND